MLHFIVNPNSKSGKGKKIWHEISPVIAGSSVTYDVSKTEYPGHAIKIARDLAMTSGGEVNAYVIMGGDGSLNEVLTGLCQAGVKRPIMGVIPTGSGNDFSRSLELSCDPETAARELTHANRLKDLDMGLVTVSDRSAPRPFAVSSGIGYDADICDKINRSRFKAFFNKLHIGKVAYTLIGLIQAIRYKKADGTITFDNNISMELKNIAFISCHNLRCEGGGWPFAPSARPDDGFMDICIVTTPSRLKFAIALISSRFGGAHVRSSAVHIIKSKTTHLKLNKKLTVHADGEILGKFDSVTFETVPHAMRLMMK